MKEEQNFIDRRIQTRLEAPPEEFITMMMENGWKAAVYCSECHRVVYYSLEYNTTVRNLTIQAAKIHALAFSHSIGTAFSGTSKTGHA